MISLFFLVSAELLVCFVKSVLLGTFACTGGCMFVL